VDSRNLPRSLRPLLLSVCLLVAFAGICRSPLRSPEPSPQERRALAEAFLQQRLATWQERLNLKGWTISVLQSHPTEMRRGTLGNIHWDNDKQTATIRVLAASDYQLPFNAALKDMQFTVVHELVHLELSSLTRNFKSRSEESYSGEEQAVNGIADALLKLDTGRAQ
jgi:hypothetical protein